MIIELSVAELQLRNSDDYILIDTRETRAYQNGAIPGAISIPAAELEFGGYALPSARELIIYCMSGRQSPDIARHLRARGYTAFSLIGGYAAWLLQQTPRPLQEIENSLRKKFHKSLFSRFTKAVKRYALVQEGDRIAVCISGGKDSMLMAKLFQELQRHRQVRFDLTFLVMDPGYNSENRAVIERNAQVLGIPITIFETDIFEAVAGIKKSPCYLCARMRRGHLYSQAKALGCNKIALGHHYDDVIETILMGMLYGAQVQTMMPRLPSTNFGDMELIRPLYLIREADIIHFRDYHKLRFIQCACRFTENCTTCTPDGNVGSKRLEIKQLIQRLKETNPNVEKNIFNSVKNVNLDTIISYKKDGKIHHFLDSL